MRVQKKAKKRVLAVSSSGGHWAELVRLSPAFANHDVIFVIATPKEYADAYNLSDYAKGGKIITINDANRWDKVGLIQMLIQLIRIFIQVRPDVVISTGAASGFFAVCLGKLLRAKTIWVDSIANAEQLSMSGQLAGKYADLWLTQWPHLERNVGPYYRGDVL
ncbi:MAG: hypothetical protein DSM107014_03060 [Gomphosphaeria aponina SAG 52.96 = DSM 107014]|uniref:UDP-N-acetylglucosamine transferase subunit ALG14 n=1 Tax=Gomphosphaeria aponina SAG 52.96 = DSM 107014 TaxID=1521640 RepID=A0A941GRW5_9CHRO|nr:hypothetical protein [Gomphosphaeria aponina SAG 52.96 = DSM 107014]